MNKSTLKTESLNTPHTSRGYFGTNRGPRTSHSIYRHHTCSQGRAAEARLGSPPAASASASPAPSSASPASAPPPLFTRLEAPTNVATLLNVGAWVGLREGMNE